MKQPDDSPIPASYPRMVQVKTTFRFPDNSWIWPRRQPFIPILLEDGDSATTQTTSQRPTTTTPRPAEEKTQVIRLDADGTKVLLLNPPLNSTSLDVEVCACVAFNVPQSNMYVCLIDLSI